MNCDAVFAKIADEILLNQDIRHPETYYLYRLRREVFGPLRRQGTSEEALEKLETRAKGIFNMQCGSRALRLHRSKMVFYDKDENNAVPRVNGARR